MKRRFVRMSMALTVGSAILVGGLWTLTNVLGDHEAMYQQKPTYYWLNQLRSGDPASSNQATAVLVKEIIPKLTEAMFHDTNDSSFRVALVEKLNSLPGVLIYFTHADGRRAGAATAMGEFGPAAKAAIPALLQALKSNDSAVHGSAINALGKIQSEPDVVIPLLISYLDDKDLNDEAAQALGNFGGQAKVAMTNLIPLLKVRDKDLHYAVVGALRKIDPEKAAELGIK